MLGPIPFYFLCHAERLLRGRRCWPRRKRRSSTPPLPSVLALLLVLPLPGRVLGLADANVFHLDQSGNTQDVERTIHGLVAEGRFHLGCLLGQDEAFVLQARLDALCGGRDRRRRGEFVRVSNRIESYTVACWAPCFSSSLNYTYSRTASPNLTSSRFNSAMCLLARDASAGVKQILSSALR